MLDEDSDDSDDELLTKQVFSFSHKKRKKKSENLSQESMMSMASLTQETTPKSSPSRSLTNEEIDRRGTLVYSCSHFHEMYIYLIFRHPYL